MITWHSCSWCRRRCAQLVRTMPHRPAIRHGHQWVFYTPATDTLHMPIPPCFQSPEAYDATLCHELVHATIDTSAAYLRNWMAALRHDPTMLVQAAAQAQRAADYIQYLQPEAGV